MAARLGLAAALALTTLALATVALATVALATVALATVACADPPPGAGAPIVEALNAHRAHEGHPPLRHHGALQAAADEVVAKVERRGTTRNVDLGIHAFVSRVRQRGYVEGKLVIGTVSGGHPAEVAEQWPEVDPTLWNRLLDPVLRDVAVAVGRKGRDPFVLVLAGVTQAERLAERAEPLELAEVRRQILRWTNELRTRRGLRNLRADKELDAVAQSYADDMIARGFYGHESPEGTTVMDRVQRGGYRAAEAGENLAEGSADPREVFDGWVESPSHRENLLFPSFRHLGVGMARGWTDDGDYRIVWVQVFGRSR